ncbi:MAG: hypothetical protein EOO20_05135 [Chryseobacterium sp.]|nr:MAG: hypothetical protein EOO20_05135 [Chryseobacterium sp.]
MTVKDIVGTYVSNFRVNNLDTLKVNTDGTYEKHVYRISDNRLIYQNKGSWELRDGRIISKDFFESDQAFSKEFKGYSDILITTSLDVNNSFGKVSFDFSEEKNDYLYRKL